MNCARLRQMLDAFVDHELDAATTAEIEVHLAACAECARLRAERVAMLDRIGSEALHYAAPRRLRNAIVHGLGRSSAAVRRRPMSPSWMQAGLLATVTAFAGVIVGTWLGGMPPVTDGHEQAVASHVASLAPPRRLTDVASTDRHIIKPWLSGKIDFAAPVVDLKEGYALMGARLDHVGDRQAAALVYRLRNHDINLFVWRASREGSPTATAVTTVRGFGVATWTEHGLQFAAVSDADHQDLARFADLIRAESQ